MQTKCSIPECVNPHAARGYCWHHWYLWRKTQTGPLPPKPRMLNRPRCSVEGCDAFVHGHGLCMTHYQERWEHDALPVERSRCAIEGCGKPVHGRGWCANHLMQWRRKGDPLYVEPRETVEERFLKYAGSDTPTDACKLWTGPLDPAGYGQLSLGGRNGGSVMAHRYAYERTHGHIADGLWIRHRCPNGPLKGCVNESHLLPGTQLQNAQDSIEDGTVARGEGHHAAKITDAIVREMRASRAAGTSCGALARRFGVTTANVSLIVRRKAWRHIE